MDQTSQLSPSNEIDYYAIQEDERDVEEEEICRKMEATAAATTSAVAPAAAATASTTAVDQANDEVGTQANKRKCDEEINEAGNVSHKKPTRPKSWAWAHFSERKVAGSVRAECNWCGTSYACDRKRNGTSNMIGHLLKQCKKFPKNLRDPKQSVLTLQPKRREQGEGSGSNLTAVCFDNDLSREALARLIAIDELPFRFVEGEGFRYFMSVVQPLFNVPSRFTVARDCYKLYVAEKTRLKSIFSRNLQYVSLTSDCWTSVQNLNYLCLTAHFIDSEWNYQKRVINFCQVPDHKGETIGMVIEKKLLEWKIEKVFSITLDNAYANNKAIQYLKRRINGWKDCLLKCDLLHVRCCAHVLNLIVKDGLDEVESSILKIRNAVRYVRSSPSRLAKFKVCIEDEKIESKSSVCLDVSTRWNSTYLMLDSALKFQSAFERLEDTSKDYLNEFTGENEKKQGPPRHADWEVAKKFVKFLKVFFDATRRISASTHATSHMYFHDFCTILDSLNKWCESDDIIFRPMAERMKKKYDKYWGDIENMNLLFLVACVLDPRYKMKYIEFACARLYDPLTSESLIENVKRTLYRLFEHYHSAYGLETESAPVERQTATRDIGEMDMSSVFELEMDKEDELESKTEVELYLAEGREKRSDKFDILNWWNVNSSKYPVLALMARDVLAVPMSTVASESAFSTGERVLDPYRSSLDPSMVEALICSENWYRSTPLPIYMEPIDEAEKYMKEVAKLGESLGNLYFDF